MTLSPGRYFLIGSYVANAVMACALFSRSYYGIYGTQPLAATFVLWCLTFAALLVWHFKLVKWALPQLLIAALVAFFLYQQSGCSELSPHEPFAWCKLG